MRRFIFLVLVAASFAVAIPATATTLPSQQRTPGEVRSDITDAQVCAPGGVTAPTVTSSIRSSVYSKYAIAKKQRARFTIDFLVPYQLGGSATAKNLWPMPSKDAAAKSSATQAAVTQVCAKAATLSAAQGWFTPTGWKSASTQAENARVLKASNDAKFIAGIKAEEARQAAAAAAAAKAEQDRVAAEQAAAVKADAERQRIANSCPNGTYVNTAGNTVCSPYQSTGGAPAGATAQCRDGSYSFSQSRSGTCSSHGGVAAWL